MVKLPEEALTNRKTIIEVGIYKEGKRIGVAKAKFIGPIKSFKK